MRNKLLAAAAVLAVFSAQSIAASADYGYDNYGYSYNQDTDTTYNYSEETSDNYGYYSGSDETNSDDSNSDVPTVVTLETTKITDLKFDAKLKITTANPITAADITITYDTDVFKLTGNKINEEAGGDPAASDMGSGVFQYVYTNEEGSEWEEEYLTLSFEVLDTTVGSSVLYIAVNTMLDTSLNEITTTADGTVVQIEGAVPADASADESMYSEIRVAKGDSTISYDSMGLKDVKSVTLEDGELATADDSGITTLAEGITNMTVEFSDGTFKYYRLVISEPKAETTAAAEESPEQGAAEEAVQTAVTINSEGTITKAQTHNYSGVKKMIILLVVVLAICAIAVEYLMIFIKPFTVAARVAREKKARKPREVKQYDDDDFFPDTNSDDEYEESGEYEEEYDEEEYEDEKSEEFEESEEFEAEEESEETETVE